MKNSFLRAKSSISGAAKKHISISAQIWPEEASAICGTQGNEELSEGLQCYIKYGRREAAVISWLKMASCEHASEERKWRSARENAVKKNKIARRVETACAGRTARCGGRR